MDSKNRNSKMIGIVSRQLAAIVVVLISFSWISDARVTKGLVTLTGSWEFLDKFCAKTCFVLLPSNRRSTRTDDLALQLEPAS